MGSSEMTEKTKSNEHIILAYLGISCRSNLELLSSWVGPEVRVPTVWYTVRGTGLPTFVVSPFWF